MPVRRRRRYEGVKVAAVAGRKKKVGSKWVAVFYKKLTVRTLQALLRAYSSLLKD